jgi:putative ABC transport system ATP-binding protein
VSAAIELCDVHKRYGTDSTVEALRAVTFTIAEGELVSIVGRSGSGKTTLLHIMGALLRPTSGTVRIAGRSSPAWATRHSRGCAPTGSGSSFRTTC